MPLRGEVSEAESDLKEAIGQGGADDETVAAYAVAATLRPSDKGEGDERWRYVPLKFARACLTVNLQSVVNWRKNSRPPFCKGRFGEG
jgi:hypothetical protein